MSAIVFIPLTQGKVAVIDFEAFEKVRPYKWYAHLDRQTWYAVCHVPGEDRRQKLRMHQLIMGAVDGTEIDHRDGDGLNNVRSNLRVCSHAQNAQNRRKRKNCSSRFKGVVKNKNCQTWRARILQVDLGGFQNEEDAARAYDQKAKELFGEYACLNFP